VLKRMTMRAPVIPKVTPVIPPILRDFRVVEVSASDDIEVGSWFGRDEAVGWRVVVEMSTLVRLEVSMIVIVLAGAEAEAEVSDMLVVVGGSSKG
jgi:hypothetical protein